jgi:hypothetical protein
VAEFPVLSQICANLKAMQKVSKKEEKGRVMYARAVIRAKKKFYWDFMMQKKELRNVD